jgi:hypothetical protein
MLVQCVCQREFDVEISHAGRRFRCPHCGRHLTFPGTALSAFHDKQLVPTSQSSAKQPSEQTRLVVAAPAERSSTLLACTAVIAALAGIVSAYSLIRTMGDNSPSPEAALDYLANVTEPVATGRNSGGQSSARTPSVATDFYQRKAPIEMTRTEWIMTLRDWGELPSWWSHWPYNDDHPWTYPLNYQADLFLEITRLELTERLTDEKVQRLRKDFFKKQREYEPQAENSPHELVDRYIRAARTAISRELMQQQLNEATKYLRSMLLRADGVNSAQANPQ